MDISPSCQNNSHGLSLLTTPGNVTTTSDFTVLSLIPAGKVRPMPVVILIWRFHPVCQKAVTGKATIVSSPGRAVEGSSQVIQYLRQRDPFLCHAWTEGHSPFEEIFEVWWRGAATKDVKMKFYISKLLISDLQLGNTPFTITWGTTK